MYGCCEYFLSQKKFPFIYLFSFFFYLFIICYLFISCLLCFILGSKTYVKSINFKCNCDKKVCKVQMYSCCEYFLTCTFELSILSFTFYHLFFIFFKLYYMYSYWRAFLDLNRIKSIKCSIA